MITESRFWKDPLLEMAGRLDRFRQQLILSEEEFSQFERDVFLGFYSVRKLFEAVGKVSDSTRSAKVAIRRFPRRNGAPTVDWYNRGEFWDLYNLGEGVETEADIRWVANQLIHSFIFMPSAEGENEHGVLEPDGVYFTSDREKENRLSFVSTAEIIRLFELVGNDYPSSFQARRDPQTGVMGWSVTDQD